MQTYNRTYRHKVEDIVGDVSPHRMTTDTVKSGVRRVLTRVTVEDKSHEIAKCRLGIHTPSMDLYIDELTSLAAGTLAVNLEPITLDEGESLFAELTGPQKGDHVSMACIGEDIDL